MGCWNGTCMISNLPILNREEVKLVFLSSYEDSIKLANSSGYCYTTDLLSPVFFPITGRYNDYGTIESIQKDWVYELTTSILKKTYEAIEVEKKEIIDFTLEDIIKGIERGSLKVSEKNDIFIPSKFSFVMIRKDIWDGIIKNTKHSLNYWNLDMKGEDDFYIDGITFIDRKFKSLTANINRLKEMFGDDYRSGFIGFDSLFSFEERYFNKAMHLDFIKDNMELVKSDYVELTLIKTFLENTRKGWMVQAGKGSQNDDIRPYLLLSDLVKEVSVKFEVDYE